MDISEEWIQDVQEIIFPRVFFGASEQKFREKNGDP